MIIQSSFLRNDRCQSTDGDRYFAVGRELNWLISDHEPNFLFVLICVPFEVMRPVPQRGSVSDAEPIHSRGTLPIIEAAAPLLRRSSEIAFDCDTAIGSNRPRLMNYFITFVIRNETVRSSTCISESPTKSCAHTGRGGIRTHGPIARSPDFESGTFDHSATLPSDRGGKIMSGGSIANSK